MKYVNADETSIVQDGLKSFGLYEYFNPCMRRDTGWHILIQSTVRLLYKYNVPITAPNVHGVMKQLGFACSAAAIRWQLQSMENRSLLHECYTNERKQLGLTGLVTAATRVYTMTEHGIRTCKCIEHINEMYYIDLVDIARRLINGQRALSDIPELPEDEQLALDLNSEEDMLSEFDDNYHMTFAEAAPFFPDDVSELCLARISSKEKWGSKLLALVELACVNLRVHDVVITFKNVVAFFEHYSLPNWDAAQIGTAMKQLDMLGLIVEMLDYPEDTEDTLFITQQEANNETPPWKLPANKESRRRFLALLNEGVSVSDSHADIMEVRKQLYEMRQALNQYISSIDNTLARIETVMLTSEA